MRTKGSLADFPRTPVVSPDRLASGILGRAEGLLRRRANNDPVAILSGRVLLGLRQTVFFVLDGFGPPFYSHEALSGISR